MSETTILWIFGILISGAVGWLTFLTGKLTDVEKKVTRLEFTLIMISETAAKLLHNDDDRHELDNYIDKYLDHNYELTWAEWQELLERFEKVMNDETKAKEDRLAACLVYHICSHKLHMPPDKQKKVIFNL